MLRIDVYRNAASSFDCTNRGVSSRFNTLYVANVKGPSEAPKDAQNVVILQNHVAGCMRLVPARWDSELQAWRVNHGTWYMAGGNYGGTSDSRFSDMCSALLGHVFYGLVAIHDRVE